jgi:DNA-binding CsgD family transcriptional regulator
VSGGLLIERERELASLDSLIASAASGAGRLALIEGRAGVGKSRLLGELRARAGAGGLRVLAARAGELEREFPHGVVRQLFEPLLHSPEAEDWLGGAAAAARPVFDRPDDEESGDAGDASFSTLHGLYWLCVNVASAGPVLLAIDDLHWADGASLRFVSYLLHRLEGLPLLMAATVRSGDPGAEEALVADLAHDPATVAIHPAPLSREGARAIIAEQFGEDAEDEFADACHEATMGNPLLLRQLLTSLAAEGGRPLASHAQLVRDIGPRAISRTLLVRLRRLPPEATSVAQAVAVLGDSADVPAVAALADLEEDATAEATAALARAEILRPDPPLGFVHPLVRDAIYSELPAGERELGHARAAQLLTELGAAPEQVAAQLMVAPRRGDESAVDVLVEAGRSAEHKAALESAVAYLQRALDEPPPPERRPDIVFQLGAAEARRSAPRAAEHLRAAYETLEDPGKRAIAADVLARTLLFFEGPEQAGGIVRQAAAAVPEELTDLRQRLEALELFIAFFGADSPEAVQRLERYRHDPPGGGVGANMLTALTAYQWALADGPADACAELSLRALADGSLIREDVGLFTVAAVHPLTVADRPEAMETWDAVRRLTHLHGSLFAVLTLHLWRGAALLWQGELEEAHESMVASTEEVQLWGGFNEASSLYYLGLRGETLIELGDLDSARELIGQMPRPRGFADGANYGRRGLIRMWLADRRFEEAAEMADEYAANLPWTQNPAIAPWRTLKAEALDQLGRSEEAVALAEEELHLARRWGAPTSVGRALRIVGTIRRDEGMQALEEAIEVLEGSPSKLERAKAYAAWGSALRRARRPTDARKPLRKALELAEVCGARALGEHVRSELNAAGVRPRTTALAGVESLTASERRVAASAAEGQTNTEIAQALYVTPKTVEVHLTSVYRKLGINSRKQLPEAMAA